MLIVAAACGGTKAQPAAPTPAMSGPSAAGAAAGSGTLDHRVLTFDREDLAPDAADDGAAASPAAPSKDSVRGELVRHRATLAACLVKDAAARGEIQLVFGIAASGAVGDVYVNGVGNDELHACLAAAIKTFAFAADPGGVLTEVHYPIAIGARATP